MRLDAGVPLDARRRLIEGAARSVAVNQEVDVIKVSENEVALWERP